MSQSLQINKFGNPSEEIFINQEEPTQDSRENTIKVSISAAPVNPADLNLIEGTYGVRPNLPFTLGVEGAGTIVESPYPEYPIGGQVIFLNRVGTWAQATWVSPNDLLVIDSPIPSVQAAMLKVNPMTAWRLLTGFADLNPGDYIIQNAANSGVGQCVIQLAKILGFKTINLVRKKEQMQSLYEIGADHVFLDSKNIKSELEQVLNKNSLPKSAFNAVGGDSALRLMDCLQEQGHLITYGAMSRRSLKVPNKFLIFKRISLEGLWVSKDLQELPVEYVRETYQTLASWISEGKLTQKVHRSYKLSQYYEALKENESYNRNGKILFEPSR